MVSSRGTRKFKLSLKSKKRPRSVGNSEENVEEEESSDQEEKSSEQNILGTLENLGATCFANSVLYILRFTPDLRHRIHHLVDDIQNQNSGHVNNPSEQVMLKIHQVFNKLYKQEISREEECAYAPTELLDVIRKNHSDLSDSNQQQDAHEFLHILLDHVRNATSHTYTKVKKSSEKIRTSRTKIQRGDAEADEESTASIEKLISGQMSSCISCVQCETSVERPEDFSDIIIPVVNSLQSSSQESTDDDEITSDSSLFVERLRALETMKESDKYWCETCYHHCEARRSISYKTLPPVLLLQLARFGSAGWGYQEKLLDHIPIPLVLPCFCSQCINAEKPIHAEYQLYGIIMHIGATLASGHYIALIKTEMALKDSAGASCQNLKKCWGIWKYISKNPSLTCAVNSCCNVLLNSKTKEDTGKRKAPVEKSDDWLILDDEDVKLCSMSELIEELSEKQCTESTHTPYLLFYTNLISSP